MIYYIRLSNSARPAAARTAAESWAPPQGSPCKDIYLLYVYIYIYLQRDLQRAGLSQGSPCKEICKDFILLSLQRDLQRAGRRPRALLAKVDICYHISHIIREIYKGYIYIYIYIYTLGRTLEAPAF